MSAAELPPFIQEYFATFASSWSDQTEVDQVRFVVLDTETTGLDPRTDRLITIGAVYLATVAAGSGRASSQRRRSVSAWNSHFM